jgi:hypothetical protein
MAIIWNKPGRQIAIILVAAHARIYWVLAIFTPQKHEISGL